MKIQRTELRYGSIASQVVSSELFSLSTAYFAGCPIAEYPVAERNIDRSLHGLYFFKSFDNPSRANFLRASGAVWNTAFFQYRHNPRKCIRAHVRHKKVSIYEYSWQNRKDHCQSRP